MLHSAHTWTALCLLWLSTMTRGAEDLALPIANDERLRIELFASDPEIVTPIGIAIDSRNRIFVIESHTHMPDRDYPGPKDDRIKLLIDEDGDGRADRVTIFAHGIKEGMNLAFSPEGVLHVCHRTGVFALEDRDGDGVSDSRREVLRLETAQTYAHSCMLGVAFSSDGWLYASRGNVAGYPYTIYGADGTTIGGYGDGGNIVKCRADGTGLQEVATGFWNPFDMDFDAAGRLLCVDNDPDSRGPNRLVQIIEHGDYGFHALYGPSGLHPYDAWNGELPGTLPYIAATGEAPSGVLDAGRAGFPAEYHSALLVTSWGEHRIECFRPEPRGVSLRAERAILVQGGREFRPVGIEAAPDGAVYITDWVDRAYPNHGRGRIWKLSVKPGVTVNHERQAPLEPDRGEQTIQHLMQSTAAQDYERLRLASVSEDPFVQSAAVRALARTVYRDRVLRDIKHMDAKVRLGSLLALRRAKLDRPEAILRGLLADPDEQVRRMALVWIGESRLESLSGELKRAVLIENVSSALLETYLATAQLLSPDDLQQHRQRIPGFQIKHAPSTSLVDALLTDASYPAALRARTLSFVQDPNRPEIIRLLDQFVQAEDRLLRTEAVLTLAQSTDPQAADVLQRVAGDASQPAELRADAILGLANQPKRPLANLIRWLESNEPAIRVEAARALRPDAANQDVRQALAKAALSAAMRTDAALAEQAQFALSRQATTFAGRSSNGEHRPRDDADWISTLAGGGDVAAGRRVFYHREANCVGCHKVHGRGSQIGPDLSTIARSLGRERLIRSILAPSEEIAPEFQGYTIETKDGRVLSGLQFHFRGSDSVSLLIADGREIRLPLKNITTYKASERSLMPEDLEKQMTVEDFRNLVEFLESLK